MCRARTAALLAMVATSVAAAPVLFRSPPTLPGSATPLTADVDRDTHPDIILVYGNRFEVLLSRGADSFAPPVVTPIVAGLRRAVIADLDGNGQPDLVYSHDAEAVTVMLGSPDGTFTLATSAPAVYNPSELAVADFNGDNKLDVAVSTDWPSLPTDRITILAGDGAGHLLPLWNVGSGTAIRQLLATDVNADGKADLLALRDGGSSTLIGAGDATFVEGPAPPVATMAATGDFNGDGKRDLALLGGPSTECSRCVQVLLGPTGAAFLPASKYAIGRDPTSIAVADIDVDGRQDIVATGTGGNWVGVLRGVGDGTFTSVLMTITAPSPRGMTIGDFDWDGKVDVLTMGQSLALNHGKNDGTFGGNRLFLVNPSVAEESNSTVRNVSVADMNEDGKLDVVSTAPNPDTLHFKPVDVMVMAGDGTGSLTRLTATVCPSVLSWFDRYTAVGDVNGDGHQDVVVSASGASAVLLGHGDGTFATPIAGPSGASSGSLIDLNSDGKADLVSHSSVYLSRGDGTFNDPITLPAPALSAPQLFGDLNGDGKPDLIWATEILINDGNAGFALSSLGGEGISYTLGDFNGDGKLDVLRSDLSSGMRMQFGNGDGTFSEGVKFVFVPSLTGSIVTADFDGDGNLDFAAGTRIYLGGGDGTFRSFSRFRSLDAAAAAVGDFNGDGTPDLAVPDGYDATVAILTLDREIEPTVPSAIVLASDASAVPYGTGVKFTASITAGALPIEGAVVFAVDGVNYILFELTAASASASLSLRLPVGVHSISATYCGDDRNIGSSSGSLPLTVSKTKTTVHVTGTPNPSRLEFPVTLTLTIYGTPPFTGAVTLTVDGASIPITSEAPGRYVATIDTLSIGTHHVVGTYSGDANQFGSEDAFDQDVVRAFTQLLASSSPIFPVIGEPVRLIASFASSQADATGTITFVLDSNVVGTTTITAGVAEIALATPGPWGWHGWHAVYSGDAKYDVQTKSSAIFALLPAGAPLELLSNRIRVTWSCQAGLVSYTLYEKATFSGPWTETVYPSTVCEDYNKPVPVDSTRMFAVTGTDANGNVTPMSRPDLATGTSFAHALMPGTSVIKMQDIVEVRRAVDAVRTFAELAPGVYSPIATGDVIRAAHIMELRNALSAARAAIGMPLGFSDPVLTPGEMEIRAAHIQEIRAGVD